MQKSRHRRRAREPEDQDGGEIVDRSETGPDIFVRQKCNGSSAGFTADLVVLRSDEQGCHEARQDQHHAHDRSRGREQLSWCCRFSPWAVLRGAGCNHGPPPAIDQWHD